LAETVGLHALPGGELAPRTATTRGLGELMRAAVDSGARTLLVGLGGSASTDAGAGMLQGLGAHLRTEGGSEIGPGLAGLDALVAADLGPALAFLDQVTVVAANDASRSQAAEATLAAAARVLDPEGVHRDAAGAGAAGGTGFGLLLLGAAQRSGADAVFELVGVEGLLGEADVVVTGEGKLDAQTLQGKGPAEVARRARERGLPVGAVAGAITLDGEQLEAAGIQQAWDLTSRAGSSRRALEDGEELLAEVGRDLGLWALTATGHGSPTRN